jgi:ActR/RegA family two-component response regulator
MKKNIRKGEKKMTKQDRVLIIEDNTKLQDKFKRIIFDAGYQVDVAGTKAEAIEKIRCKTYHVAMIDIMLTDDFADRGGIECLEYLKHIDEGTEAIILSATNDVRVPVESWKKGALTYLVKKDIRSSEDLVREVKIARDKCKMNFYGPFDNLAAYLAQPEMAVFFEDNLMKVLGGNISRAGSILQQLFDPILPVLRSKQHMYGVDIDKDGKRITGLLWSKAIGSAVWVSLAMGSQQPIQPPEGCEPHEVALHIDGKNTWGGQATIWCVTKPRADFNETLFDKRT